MRAISGALTACLILGGCSSTSVVTSFEEFNAHAEGRSGTIEFRDGKKTEAQHVLAFADSTHFWSEAAGAATVVPTRTIKSVHFLNRFVGYLEGFGFGALAGSVAVLALTAASPSTGEFSGADYVVLFTLLGGGAGGVIGGIPGMIIGHSDEYQFVSIEEGLRSTPEEAMKVLRGSR